MPISSAVDDAASAAPLLSGVMAEPSSSASNAAAPPAGGYVDEADALLASAGLIDVAKIKRVQNNTQSVLHADEYANSMGISYDEIVNLTHKRNRVIKRRHPKQLQEFAVKILMKWMLSVEHFDFPYPTEREKAELCRIAKITTQQLNHWFTNARKRVWIPLRKARGLSIPNRTELVRGRQMREQTERQGAPPHAGMAQQHAAYGAMPPTSDAAGLPYAPSGAPVHASGGFLPPGAAPPTVQASLPPHIAPSSGGPLWSPGAVRPPGLTPISAAHHHQQAAAAAAAVAHQHQAAAAAAAAAAAGYGAGAGAPGLSAGFSTAYPSAGAASTGFPGVSMGFSGASAGFTGAAATGHYAPGGYTASTLPATLPAAPATLPLQGTPLQGPTAAGRAGPPSSIPLGAPVYPGSSAPDWQMPGALRIATNTPTPAGTGLPSGSGVGHLMDATQLGLGRVISRQPSNGTDAGFPLGLVGGRELGRVMSHGSMVSGLTPLPGNLPDALRPAPGSGGLHGTQGAEALSVLADMGVAQLTPPPDAPGVSFAPAPAAPVTATGALAAPAASLPATGAGVETAASSLHSAPPRISTSLAPASAAASVSSGGGPRGTLSVHPGARLPTLHPYQGGGAGDSVFIGSDRISPAAASAALHRRQRGSGMSAAPAPTVTTTATPGTAVTVGGVKRAHPDAWTPPQDDTPRSSASASRGGDDDGAGAKRRRGAGVDPTAGAGGASTIGRQSLLSSPTGSRRGGESVVTSRDGPAPPGTVALGRPGMAPGPHASASLATTAVAGHPSTVAARRSRRLRP